RSLRATARHLRRLDRVRALAGLHRGRHPRPGPAALRQHPHRQLGHRPPHRMTPRAVGGTGQDLVIFTGSGATGAVAKLVGLLGLGAAAAGPRPVVLVGPYEHPSNLLPWRESAAGVVAIGEDGDGHIDLAELEAQLVRHAGRPLMGSFSAASNVTGILSATDRIARP